MCEPTIGNDQSTAVIMAIGHKALGIIETCKLMFWLLEVLMCHSQLKLVGVGKRCKQKKIPQQVAKKFIKHKYVLCQFTPKWIKTHSDTCMYAQICRKGCIFMIEDSQFAQY